MAKRFDLDGKEIAPIRMCIIGAAGFIGSHLCEALMWETNHVVVAVDMYNDKIEHLLGDSHPWSGRMEFHQFNISNDPRLEGIIKSCDLTINLAAICTPADYNTRPLDTIYSNFVDALPVAKFCSDFKRRLIHFSTCEVYGKTVGAFLPPDSIMRNDPQYYVLKEDETPCIFGPVQKQRWSYACAKQLIERVIYAEGAENDLKFTIVRPFNWIGPRMDFIPGIDGPKDGVPRVLACFSNQLLRGEPLKLVDGGKSQRTFVYIKDAIRAVMLMIENPERANGHIFNVGNPKNEASVRELATMMTRIYCKVSKQAEPATPTVDVTSSDFYGKGYDDSDRRIPDMTLIQQQLGWEPETSLEELLDVTLTYQYSTYAEAIRRERIRSRLSGCCLLHAEAAYWANMVNRKASLGGHLQPMLKDFHHMRMRVLIPTYPCPYEERVGAWGVGGKWVCLIPTAVQAKPIVYSVGSDEESSFEEAMFRHYRSQPYTLDPFLSSQAQARMQLLRFLHFHPVGLSGRASLGDYQKWNPNVTFRTLPELMQDLNHTYIDILKLSCGGCEEEVIFDVFEGNVNGTAAEGVGRGMLEKRVSQFRGGVRNYEEGREDAVDPSVGARLAINGGKLPFGQLIVDFHEADEPQELLSLVYSLETLGYRICAKLMLESELHGFSSGCRTTLDSKLLKASLSIGWSSGGGSAASLPYQPPSLGWAAFLFPSMSGIDAAICRAEENYWENLVLRRKACNGTLFPPPAQYTPVLMKTVVLIPTYPCPANERIGQWGDGGKWTCLLPGAIQKDPVVYSIGSRGRYSFEDSIHKFLRVQPHTFDPFLTPETAASMQNLSSLHFHPIGLSANSSLQNYHKKFPEMQFLTLGGIMDMLNHSYVDVFKIDCEGCEEAVITEIGEANGYTASQLSVHGGTLPFGQILVEFHQMHHPQVILPLIYTLERLGYRMFSIEFNQQCLKCCEMSFIHESLVRPGSDKDCRPFLSSEVFVNKDDADAVMQEKMGSAGGDLEEPGRGG
ncbi:unnamed protein product [Closterium sp. Yama58-4]|nr:unnamed protein product [Closterium sp. Yama58-4]